MIPELVIVLWKDSAYHRGDFFLDELEEEETVELQSVGYLVRETDFSITLAQDRYIDDNPRYRNGLSIPKSSIIRMSRLLDGGLNEFAK